MQSAKDSVFWFGLSKNIESRIRNCEKCMIIIELIGTNTNGVSTGNGMGNCWN